MDMKQYIKCGVIRQQNVGKRSWNVQHVKQRNSSTETRRQKQAVTLQGEHYMCYDGAATSRLSVQYKCWKTFNRHSLPLPGRPSEAALRYFFLEQEAVRRSSNVGGTSDINVAECRQFNVEEAAINLQQGR